MYVAHSDRGHRVMAAPTLNSSTSSPHVLIRPSCPPVLALASHSPGSFTEPPLSSSVTLLGPGFSSAKWAS